MEKNKTTRLKGSWKIIFLVSVIGGIFFSINQIFMLRLLGGPIILSRYLYLMFTLFFPLIFVAKPATKNAPNDYVPWYDVLLFFASFFIGMYFVYYAYDIRIYGWAYTAGIFPTVLSLILLLLLFEGVRRSQGIPFLSFCFLFSIYPLVADKFPAMLNGHPQQFFDLIRLHIMGEQGITGLAFNVFANLIIGFLIFGVVLQVSGGGDFFMNISLWLMGRSRGGPAKVACISSGLFGSLSGSVVSNIITTGTMTIPAMRRTGYSATEAAAIECCASTGGVLMPPVMGSTAFIMATVLNIPYWNVAMGAAIPALLFYLSLAVQTDLSAANKGLKGWPKEEIPPFKQIMLNGWPFIFSFVVLIYCLLYLRIEAWAPFLASLVIIVIMMLRVQTRITISGFLKLIEETGLILTDLAVMIAAVGLIVSSVFVTGLGASFSREIVSFAGGNPYLLLLLGAASSFILGMGMTITAVYLFLAIILTPALETIGFPAFSVHLFLMYWAMLSYITPPVAIGSFAAASMIGGNPFSVGFASMRFGAVLYIVPFLFVMNPELLLIDATSGGLIKSAAICIISIIMFCGALQGYLYYFGNLGTGRSGILKRIILGGGSLLLLMPQTNIKLLGVGLLIVFVALWMLEKRVLMKGGLNIKQDCN